MEQFTIDTNSLYIIGGFIVAVIVKPMFEFIGTLIKPNQKEQNEEYVTQCQLLKAKNDVLDQAKREFATKEIVDRISCELTEIKGKIDTIHDILMKRG